MIINPGDSLRIDGRLVPIQDLDFFDEAGHRLNLLRWVDTDNHRFAQLVPDETGFPQVDPDDPEKPWIIEREGKVTWRLKTTSGEGR